MSPRWWVAALFLGAACSNGFWACGATGTCCSTTPAVTRDVSYVSSIPAGDGGTPTQVTLVVSTDGGARLTFVRDGVEVVESFYTGR